MGDDQPRPVIGCFQVTFFAGPHSVGRLPVAIPWPVGPRNAGQSSARTGAKEKRPLKNSAGRLNRNGRSSWSEGGTESASLSRAISFYSKGRLYFCRELKATIFQSAFFRSHIWKLQIHAGQLRLAD